MNRFLTTFSLVSRIPLKARFKFDPSRLDFFLPVVGVFPALIASLLYAAGVFFGVDGLANGAFEYQGGRIITVLLILAVQYFCFNLFHIDGLLDTADAFLGSFDKEKRLAILKDSRIGVYGFFAGVFSLALKIALFWALFPALAKTPALFAWPVFGRFSAALIPCLAPPARPEGLGALAKDTNPFRCLAGLFAALVVWLLVCAAFTMFHNGLDLEIIFTLIFCAVKIFAAQAALSFFIALFYARLYKKSLGGYTGDALGAAVETAELFAIAAAYCYAALFLPPPE